MDDEDLFEKYRRQVNKTLSLSFTINNDIVRYDSINYSRMNREGCVEDPVPPSSSNGWVVVLVLIVIICAATAASVYMYRKKVVKHIPLPTKLHVCSRETDIKHNT